MAKDPAFMFYANDWLSSLRVRRMTPAHRGAFIDLLCYCWSSGDVSLEDDDDTLAVASGLFERWFGESSTELRKMFIAHPEKPGFLTNEKLFELWTDRQENRKQASLAGKKSGESRRKLNGHKKKKQKNDRSTDVERNANENTSVSSHSVERNVNSSLSLSSSSSIEENITKESDDRAEIESLKRLAEEQSKILESVGANAGFIVGASPEFRRWFASYPESKRWAEKSCARQFPKTVKEISIERECDEATAIRILQDATDRFAASDLGQSDFCWSAETFLMASHWKDPAKSWERSIKNKNGPKSAHDQLMEKFEREQNGK